MDRNHILHAVWVIFFFVGEIFSYQLALNKQWADGPVFFSLAVKCIYIPSDWNLHYCAQHFWQRDAWNAGRWCAFEHTGPIVSCPYVSIYGNYALAVIIFIYNMRALGHLLPDRRGYCFAMYHNSHIRLKKKMLNLSGFNALSGVNMVTRMWDEVAI